MVVSGQRTGQHWEGPLDQRWWYGVHSTVRSNSQMHPRGWIGVAPCLYGRSPSSSGWTIWDSAGVRDYNRWKSSSVRLGVSSSSVGTCRSWWVGSVRTASGDLSNLRGVQVFHPGLLGSVTWGSSCLLAPWAGSNLT